MIQSLLKGGEIMKMNSDCVREVLLTCEEVPLYSHPPLETFFTQKRLEKYSSDEIAYSMKKLVEAGFVDFKTIRVWGGPDFDGTFLDITWHGHQFLDAIRSDTVWTKTKEKISSTVGSTSLQVMGTLASTIASKLLGL